MLISPAKFLLKQFVIVSFLVGLLACGSDDPVESDPDTTAPVITITGANPLNMAMSPLSVENHPLLNLIAFQVLDFDIHP